MTPEIRALLTAAKTYLDKNMATAWEKSLQQDALRAAIAAAEAESDGWISVKERMPEKWIEVLVAERHEKRACCAYWLPITVNGKERIIWHQDDEHLEADSGNYGNGACISHRELEVTHWRPLPPPPTEEQRS